MAVHVYNLLKELAEGKHSLESIRGVIGNTPMGDLIDYNEWQDIYHSDDLEEALVIIKAILPKYEKLWKLIGEPRTHEDWQKARSYKYRTKLYKTYRAISEDRMYKRIWNDTKKCYVMEA